MGVNTQEVTSTETQEKLGEEISPAEVAETTEEASTETNIEEAAAGTTVAETPESES